MAVHELDQRIVVITPPAAIIDNASPTTAVIDRVVEGVVYDYCSVYVVLGATDVALTVLKMQQSDASGSGFADIDGMAYGGTGNPALPTATDDNKVFAFHLDCRGLKRYLDLAATIGDGSTGAYFTAFAILSRGKESPDTAAKRGCAAEIFYPA